MNNLSLSFAARVMNAAFHGQDVHFSGINSDTRKLSPGELFVALPGTRVDGHEYIHQAEMQGAAGALISRPIETSLPVLLVENTLKAAGILAKAYRQCFTLPMVAVTGSCGKTTVKEMINNIFSLAGPVLCTQGNLNTEIGVPITLLRLRPEHRLAVIEMGARQKGDIAYLMNLASPNISLITNAGMAHLEIFGTDGAIAEAKGEIFSFLPETGIAIINQDDKHAGYWKTLIKPSQSIITFGMCHQANIMAKEMVLKPTFSEFVLTVDKAGTDRGEITIRLPSPGKHAVQNALAAASAATAAGICLEVIKSGLEVFVPVNGRLQFKPGFQGTTIIDDTYNANPVSMRAALAVLAQHTGTKIFVMGDMFELGEKQWLLHQQMGEEAKRLGIDKLLGVGELSCAAVQAFGEGACHYPDKHALAEALLQQRLTKNTLILVKGSRGMHMDEVVLKLTTCEEKNAC